MMSEQSASPLDSIAGIGSPVALALVIAWYHHIYTHILIQHSTWWRTARDPMTDDTSDRWLTVTGARLKSVMKAFEIILVSAYQGPAVKESA